MLCTLLLLATWSVYLPAHGHALASQPVGCFATPGDCGYPDPTATSGSAVVGPVDGNGNSVACSDLPTFSFDNLNSYPFAAGVYWPGPGSNLLEITGPNVTVSNLNLGDVIIYDSSGADNFTLDNVCMNPNGGQNEGSIAVNIPSGLSGATIEHSRISGANDTTQSIGIGIDNNGTGTIIRNNYIYNVGGGGPGAGGGDATVEDNYELINATVYGSGSPAPEEHYEPIYCIGNTLTINHNTLLNPHSQTAVVFCDSGAACNNHLTITDNLMAGGGYMLYPCGNASSVGTSTMDIENNRFARCGYGTCPNGADANGYYPAGGYYSAAAYYFTGTGQTWSGNYWDDSLDSVAIDGSTGPPIGTPAPICVASGSQQLCRIASSINITSTDLTVPANEILTVDGSVCAVTVQDGGVLKGGGTVCGLTISAGGTVSPGHSPGVITVAGNLTQSGTYNVQMQTPGTTAGTDYDQIVVTGTVNLSGGSLDPELLNGFQPSVGQAFKIIDNQGGSAVNGTYNGLPEGAVFAVGSTKFQITYKGGDGNDVLLTVVSPDTPVTATIPKAPNTGFAAFVSTPVCILAIALAAAAALTVLGYRSGLSKLKYSIYYRNGRH